MACITAGRARRLFPRLVKMFPPASKDIHSGWRQTGMRVISALERSVPRRCLPGARMRRKSLLLPAMRSLWSDELNTCHWIYRIAGLTIGQQAPVMPARRLKKVAYRKHHVVGQRESIPEFASLPLTECFVISVYLLCKTALLGYCAMHQYER